ncbi:MAG: O-antigen ligase family protein [bacterium]|nr:O-antigen ligase family protein [bacterium]
MMEFIRNYKAKAWPTIEIPTIKSAQLVLLIIYTAAMVAGGWMIWLSGNIRAEYFALLGIGIPILLLIKSRYLTIVGLLSLQVVMAFLFIGNSGYVILIVVAFAGAIISFQSTSLMYVLLIFTVWFDTSAFVGGINLKNEFAVGFMLLLGWIFRDVLGSNKASKSVKYFPKWSAIVFLAWALIGFSFWCLEPFPAGWDQVKQLLTHIIFFLITPLVIRDRQQLKIILWAWVAAGVIAAVAELIAPYLGFTPTGGSWGGGTSIASGHKNITASFLSFSFFITYALYRAKGSLMRKVALMSGLFFIFTAMFFLQSKGAMIGLAVGIVLFKIADTFFATHRKNALRTLRNSFFIVGTAVLMILMIYVVGISEYILGYYSQIFTQGTEMSTMEIRKILWQASWQMINDGNHPIRGLGPGAFWVLGLDYVPVEYYIEPDNKNETITGESAWMQTHNIYLDIFLQYGVVGIVSFSIFVFSIIKNLWKRFKFTPNASESYLFLSLACGIIAFLTHSFFDFSIFFVARFWIYCGLCVACLNILSDEYLTDRLKPSSSRLELSHAKSRFTKNSR